MKKNGKFWFLSIVLGGAALAAWFGFQNLDFELWEPVKQAEIPAAIPRVIKIDLNNPEDLASWNRHSFHGETRYEIHEEPDGTKSLKAASENACSAIFKPVEVSIAEQPVLSWQWKVKKFPAGKTSPVFGAGNESDYAARVSVIFKSELPLQQDIVQYVWDDRFPVGTHGSSPFWKKVKILVVRSGLPSPEGTAAAAPPDPEAWVSEKRDITRDYTMLFGKPPAKDIEAIGLMADSDDTKTSTEAYYRNFEIQTLPFEEAAGKKVRKKKLSIPLAPALRKTGKVVQALFKIPSEKIPKILFFTTKKVVSWPVAKAKALGERKESE